MGNLFIGFPVPRAKIAEMIETAAPPILHADRHEATGDDEIAFQNILNRKHATRHESGGDDLVTIPPAGLATLYDDLGFHYKTRFPTLDEFDVTEYDSGTVEHSHEGIYLSTGGTLGSYANVKKGSANQLPQLSYDKNIFLRFKILSTVFSDVNPNAYIITAGETNEKHIGISIYNLKLAYSVHNGSTRAQGAIYTWGSPPEDFTYTVEIKFYAGSRAEYYIDGNLVHTQTEYLPSGWFADEYFLKLAVANSDTTRDLFIAISMLELYQPAT